MAEKQHRIPQIAGTVVAAETKEFEAALWQLRIEARKVHQMGQTKKNDGLVENEAIATFMST